MVRIQQRWNIWTCLYLSNFRDYAEDLRNLLSESAITEQRSILRSCVEKIEVSDAEVKMYYTIPVTPDSAGRKRWELYLSYTTVEGEADTGGEVDNTTR